MYREPPPEQKSSRWRERLVCLVRGHQWYPTACVAVGRATRMCDVLIIEDPRETHVSRCRRCGSERVGTHAHHEHLVLPRAECHDRYRRHGMTIEQLVEDFAKD